MIFGRSFSRVNRKTFICYTIALMILPPFTWLIFERFPAHASYARHLNWGVTIVLMLLSAARLADAGYSRWMGFAGVLVPIVVIPILATFVGVIGFKIPAAVLMTYATYLVVPAMALLLLFLVWAACLPSSDLEMDFERDYGARDVSRFHDRIDPRF